MPQEVPVDPDTPPEPAQQSPLVPSEAPGAVAGTIGPVDPRRSQLGARRLRIATRRIGGYCARPFQMHATKAWPTSPITLAAVVVSACGSLKDDNWRPDWADVSVADTSTDASTEEGTVSSAEALQRPDASLDAELSEGTQNQDRCESECRPGGEFRCRDEHSVEICASQAVGCRTWIFAGVCPEASVCCNGQCMSRELALRCTDPGEGDGGSAEGGADRSVHESLGDASDDRAASVGSVLPADDGPSDGEAVVGPSLPDRDVLTATSSRIGCHATMLTNQWAISTNDCFDYGSDSSPGDWTVYYGGPPDAAISQSRVKRLVRHPTNRAEINPKREQARGVNLVLLELEEPLRIDGSTQEANLSLFTGTTSDLLNRAVWCAGELGAQRTDASSDRERDGQSQVVDIQIAATAEFWGSNGPAARVHVGDLVRLESYGGQSAPRIGESPGSACYARGPDASSAWRLAVVQGRPAGSANTSGSILGTSLVEDSVLTWIEQALGGFVRSEAGKPGVAYSPSGVLHLFWRSARGTVMHKTYSKQMIWSSEEDFGWSTTSAPSGVASRGSLEVYWRGPDYRIRYRRLSDADGGAEEVMAGPPSLSGPSVSARTDGRVDVVWRGMDNRLVHRWRDTGGVWREDVDFVPLLPEEPKLESGPTLHWRTNDYLDVVWRGAYETQSRYAMHAWYCLWDCGESGTWGPAPVIENHGESLEGDPAFVSSDDENTLHFVWRVGDGRLIHRGYVQSMPWSSEKELAAGVLTGPAVVSRSAGELDIFWRSSVDGRLKNTRFFDGKTSDIQDVGGALFE